MTLHQQKNKFELPLFPTLLILISLSIVFFRLLTLML